MTTVRLTVGQAVVRFLGNQWTERDDEQHRLIEGCFGIFGHGNVAGIGQALLEAEISSPGLLVYRQARNEQAMVHAAVGFARASNRMSALACTTSIGPGATNMVTGAALATINRLPVLLLPGDVFATRVADPVLQQLEHPTDRDVSVNDAFRPVSQFFDRVDRPEQLPDALLGAMGTLTDPASTGAVTLSLPQDVQAEAFDWPAELFERRVWRVERPAPDASSLQEAVQVLRRARRPLVVAGGGVIYSGATAELLALAQSTGIPVAETQAGKGSIPFDHPQAVGAVGATGTTAANALARRADVVLGVGTRWTDFTTASRTLFAEPDVRFVSVNVARADARKNAGVAVTADARVALDQLHRALGGHRVAQGYLDETSALRNGWHETVDRAFGTRHSPLPSQSEVIGAVNEVAQPSDVVVCAAGSMPGDLHKLWRSREPGTYHVEYGYSCMGYEIAGGIGVKLAAPEREVYVLVGDGSYLMMAQELVTAVQEGIKVVVVVVDNHGFASIGALSESVGSQRFGTSYRRRDPRTGRLDGDVLAIDLVANAESLGVRSRRVHGVDALRAALLEAAGDPAASVVCVETDPLLPAPSSGTWWDVPVAEVSALDSTQSARKSYDEAKREQRRYL